MYADTNDTNTDPAADAAAVVATPEAPPTFWFTAGELDHIDDLLKLTTTGTPFAGASWRRTGEKTHVDRYGYEVTVYAVELIADVTSYLEIPDHTLIATAKAAAEGEWFVNLLGETTYADIAEDLDPRRCDVCGIRHNRTKLYIMVEDATGDHVVTGGTCARKFRNVDLLSAVDAWFRLRSEVAGDIDEKMDKLRGARDFWIELAAAEHIVTERGYVSAADAEEKRTTSTTSELVYWCDRGWKEMDAKTARGIYTRATELMDGGAAELLAWIDARNADRPSSFWHNCGVALRTGDPGRGRGLVAFLGSVKMRIAEDAIRAARPPAKNYADAPLKKMIDLDGWWTVLRSKWFDGYGYTDSIGYTMTNEDGVKIWWKSSVEGNAANAIFSAENDANLNGVDHDRIQYRLRGKAKEHKDGISFFTHIKVLDTRVVDGADN